MVLTLLFSYIAFAMGFYAFLVLQAPIMEDMETSVLPVKTPEIVELFPAVDIEATHEPVRRAA